jgi:hypothetical protein
VCPDFSQDHAQDALSYVGQKLSLKGVNEDTMGIPIRRLLDNVGEIDLQLRTATLFSELDDGETRAYVIVSPSTKYLTKDDLLAYARDGESPWKCIARGVA